VRLGERDRGDMLRRGDLDLERPGGVRDGDLLGSLIGDGEAMIFVVGFLIDSIGLFHVLGGTGEIVRVNFPKISKRKRRQYLIYVNL